MQSKCAFLGSLIFAVTLNTSALTITSSTTLNANVYESIQINASNVTLDLNGYNVIGSGTGTGIYVNGRSNVAIKCTRGYGYIQNFGTGINFTSGSGNSVDKIVATNCGVGISINSSNVSLTNSYANNSSQEGIDMNSPSSCYLSMMNANYNVGGGYDQNYGAYTYIYHLNANYNNNNGIEFDETSNFSVIQCTTYDNDKSGLSFTDNATNGSISSCASSSNTQDGIHVKTGSTPLTFTNCSAHNNGDDNLDDDVGGNTYINCSFN